MSPPHPPGEDGRAAALAAVLLPQVDDLPGDGWTVAEGDGGGEAGGVGTTDLWVPADYPDHARVADADRTFVKPGRGMVHAVATVFDTVPAAVRAWQALADEAFAERFASSVAADAQLPDAVVLLGPVMGTVGFAADRRGGRTFAQRATFSRADGERVLPLVLDLGVVAAGRAVVLVWAAAEGEDGDTSFAHLLHRVELRAEAALAEG